MGGMGSLGEVGGKRPQAPDAYQPAPTPEEESDKGWVGWEEETDSLARQCEQWKEGGEVKECLPPATPPMPPRLLRWACALGFKSQEFPWDF
jgi:hypothetical protein